MIAFLKLGDDIPADMAISKDTRNALLGVSMPKFSLLHVRVIGLTRRDVLGDVVAYSEPSGVIVPLAQPLGPVVLPRATVTFG